MAQLQRLAIAPSQLQDGLVILTGEQQHYLCRVLRLQTGDRFIAMDGIGNQWLAQLLDAQAEILHPVPVETELAVAIALIVALPKGNGFDEVVRQTTELGVSSLVPVVSDRTLLVPSSHKLDRWRRIAREAAEQSERQLIPTILEPLPFATLMREKPCDTLGDRTPRFLCVARGEYPHLLARVRQCADSLEATKKPGVLIPGYTEPHLAIATGPEGGWTPAEVESAIASGFQPVSLGRRILRAVTAPTVALSLAVAALEVERKDTERIF